MIKITFCETENAEFSTIESYQDSDFHSKQRLSAKSYKVESISLEDLLEYHKAPYEIDYLPIDTEGSEFHILKDFNFSKYKINIITVEHNYTENRGKIFKMPTRNGFVRMYESISLFDDWYVRGNIFNEIIN